VTTETTITDPTRLRTALTDQLRARRRIRTPQVESAFRHVPRHLFLPGVQAQRAYAANVVVTKRAEDGTALSSATSPGVVADMLEQLDVQPGHRVLEIGAATGINAALLQELVGPTGHVTTIDIDHDLADQARRNLSTAGYGQVDVICADGAEGHPARAPFDRIIVTAGAWDIAPAWWRQLGAGGRLVVPLRLHGSGLTRSIAFDLHQPDRMLSNSALVCGFVPMRGTAVHTEHSLPIADDVILHLGPDNPSDTATGSHPLTYPPHQNWTGVMTNETDPVEHLDLWLATTSRHFARLSAGPKTRNSGLVTPALRWAGAALYDGGTLAYLSVRPHTNDTTELGVTALGPNSTTLATRTADLLHRWARRRPTQPVITAQPAATPDDQLPEGHHIDKPHTRLTIAW
jgi:protein-L-isoaspartate(D-aspartate) O-methyltransferase